MKVYCLKHEKELLRTLSYQIQSPNNDGKFITIKSNWYICIKCNVVYEIKVSMKRVQ